jgi:multiple sugar transport system ATP-binding protein
MNLRDATVVNGETLNIDAGSFDLMLPSTIDQMGRVGDGARRLGLRPSDIRLSDGTPTEPSFDATVAMVETFGDTNWYYLDVGDRDQIVMKSADEEVLKTVESGDEITVSVQVDDIHLFDPETGEAIT